MLLDKIYSDFVAHTNLTDSVYKSVFVSISEILTKINAIDLISLTYIDPDDGKTTFEFNKLNKIPRYISELFQNVFRNYYTLPNNASIVLIVSYNNKEYEIRNAGLETIIPDDIKFLENFKLSNWFILDRPVIDLFGEFDRIFEFTGTFKSPVSNIFEPLRKKLEKNEADEQILDGNISTSTVAGTQLTVETLQEKIKDILGNIDTLRQKRDKLQLSRNSLITKINSREASLLEKDKLTIEIQTLNETRQEYVGKRDKISAVITEIDAFITDLNKEKEDGEIVDTELNLYIEKKIIFEKELNSYNSSIKDFEGLLKNLSGRLSSITNDLSEVENYTTNDIETLEANIDAINVEQENLYSILLGLEAELKHQKSLLDKNSVNLEKAASASVYSDVAIQNIEINAITNHLASTNQPTSVTTVTNYLRYYFSYYSTLIAKSFLDSYPGLDTYLAQAVASRVVLLRYFGVYFNKMFSAIDFVDNRIGKVIHITQD